MGKTLRGYISTEASRTAMDNKFRRSAKGAATTRTARGRDDTKARDEELLRATSGRQHDETRQCVERVAFTANICSRAMQMLSVPSRLHDSLLSLVCVLFCVARLATTVLCSALHWAERMMDESLRLVAVAHRLFGNHSRLARRESPVLTGAASFARSTSSLHKTTQTR